jgi:hypothetical protein
MGLIFIQIQTQTLPEVMVVIMTERTTYLPSFLALGLSVFWDSI